MTKQEFLALGLTDEQATKAEEASKKELETYIPKTRFDEVNEAKKQAEKDVKERDAQIETLKKSAGDNESLTKQITELQEQNKTATAKYESEMKELRLTNAIKLAIAGRAHDEDLVAGLFDKTKLILGDDGKVTGLDDQMKELQKSKAFLFKPETDPNQHQKQNGFQVGGQQQQQQQNGGNVSLHEALAARFAQQK